MKIKQILGIAGAILLFAGSIIPIATLNNNIITYLPIWNNTILEKGLWNWRDISFFSITLFILILLSVYFSIKKIFTGLTISGLVALFVNVILFFTILETKAKLSGLTSVSFSIKWGWIILLSGTVLLIVSGMNKIFPKNKTSV